MLAIALLSLLAAFWAARVVNASELDHRFDRMEAWLRRFGPFAAAIVSAAVIWWVWGAVSPLAIAHEENGYVLQAQIFAGFRWTAPSPLIPDFFEQPHVIVEPAVASKYAPGHALLLAVGAFAGFPALMPLLITGATAAFLFALVMRVTNPWIGLLTWITWLTTPLVLRYQPGYFAEATTTVCILAAWWSLLEWRRSRRKIWIVVTALATAWAAITQPIPLTVLAFALPIAAVVIADVVRKRLWIDVLLVIITAAAVLAIVPLWSARTTGDRNVTPVARYNRDYLPFEKAGFNADTTPSRRDLSPVMKSVHDEIRRQHEQHRLRNLPLTLWRRAFQLARDLWGGTQLLLLPFAITGLFFMSREVRMAVVSAGILIVAHVAYAADPSWTLPYLEIVPVVAALTAIGLWHALARFAPGIGTLDAERRPELGTALVALVLAVFALPTLGSWHARHRDRSSVRAAFEEALAQLPSRKSIVFLRYAPRTEPLNLVVNFADPNRAPAWVVHDLGERNRELLQLAADRTAYIFDEAAMELRRF